MCSEWQLGNFSFVRMTEIYWRGRTEKMKQKLRFREPLANFQEMLICAHFKEAPRPRLKVDICGIFKTFHFQYTQPEWTDTVRQSSLWEERSGIMQFTAQGPSEPFGSQGFWSIKYEREYSDAEKVNLQAEQKVNRGFCTGIECAYCMCVYVIKTSMSHSGESTLTHNSANAERMSPKQHDSCCFLTPNLNHLSPLTQKMFWRMFMLKLNALFTENVVLCCSSQIFQIIKHTLLQYVAKKKKLYKKKTIKPQGN